jgi:hypothetical protein
LQVSSFRSELAACSLEDLAIMCIMGTTSAIILRMSSLIPMSIIISNLSISSGNSSIGTAIYSHGSILSMHACMSE